MLLEAPHQGLIHTFSWRTGENYPWNIIKYSSLSSSVIIFMVYFFLLLHEICCGYSLEVPQRHLWGTSNEYPQHMFFRRTSESHPGLLIRCFLSSPLVIVYLYWYLINRMTMTLGMIFLNANIYFFSFPWHYFWHFWAIRQGKQTQIALSRENVVSLKFLIGNHVCSVCQCFTVFTLSIQTDRQTDSPGQTV